MKVSVVGTGYVGLVSGTCLAEKGHQVTCVDIDQAKVDQINQGIPPIYEAGLEEMLKANVGTRLKATTDLRDAVMNSEISLIAVGTPFRGMRSTSPSSKPWLVKLARFSRIRTPTMWWW